MNVSDHVKQEPDSGTHILRFRGDTQSFVLSLPKAEKGGAWLRTNIGHAQEKRDEIIREVLYEETRLHKDWFDIPMASTDGRHFQVTLALCEIGHFEAKCFFLPDDKSDPIWPAGGNITINVEPADTCCSNIVYNAFVRQFGPYKEGKEPQPRVVKDSIRVLDDDGYTVIPPSGTFRDFMKELDFIIGELGCRIIQLLPIHPTPTTFARMGRFGSPYAALSFTTVDPALAEFDPRATPTEQFKELVGAIHERNAKVFIDIAINHTGWAARLHNTHPEWLSRDTDGRIEAPGAWGITWADLTKLNYTHKDLWQYMAEVFLLWCRRGVDGFRCDAGYMIPVPAWTYMIAVVRQQFPDTVFLLEGLGGSISVTRDILNTANMNWAYSELFQNYDRTQLEHYLPEPIEISREDGIMIHFAETHDNLRLAERSEVYARMRTALCALCSQHGGFGFANGVEWFATERINVHKANSLNWGAESNQVELIQRLIIILKYHPAFHEGVEISMVHQRVGNAVALLRCHVSSEKRLLVLANLDVDESAVVAWDPRKTGMDSPVFFDLITGIEARVQGSQNMQTCRLDPGQVMCLTAEREEIEILQLPTEKRFDVPDRIIRQGLRAKALDVHNYYMGTCRLGDFDREQAALELAKDPVAYCRNLNTLSEEARVITWHWPEDVRREVMVPPDHFLLVRAEASFCAQVVDRNLEAEIVFARENSLPCDDGSHFALFSPAPCPDRLMRLTLRLSVYLPARSKQTDAHLLILPKGDHALVNRLFSRSEVLHGPLLLLGTNGCGGMLRADVDWSRLHSKYDAFLAANLNPDFPEDRWVMFTRCRAWFVYQGYSKEINNDCLDSFHYDGQFRGHWKYRLPCGQGQHVFLNVMLEMAQGANAVRLSFYRHKSGGADRLLSDENAVRVILRPDIEDRNFHHTTKGYLGPEHDWPQSVIAGSKAFTFSPKSGQVLHISISDGRFVSEPEWQYMVHRSMEAERGMDPDSDLFSPGYFSASLRGGQSVSLSAQVGRSQETVPMDWNGLPENPEDSLSGPKRKLRLPKALLKAMDAFVVRRKKLNTVIAGYPWFLDWGRDTLIFVRGLIAAGQTSTAGVILEQFARFEDKGTLPNMIRGDHVANRDTSDAPFWFFVACSDMVNAQGNEIFLDTDCGGRTIRQVLKSIAHSVIAGTPNGLRMDPDSALIFSPSHFTWMDTNHPAGTPREGYPIEIQALWHFAASFMTRIDPSENRGYWRDMAATVQQSILDLFFLEREGFLSDCLHTNAGKPAVSASPDDALRPNQLFAVTLGALTDVRACRRIVHACETLIVPGAIRSLADREVRYPIPIIHHGKTINHPNEPYQGKYEGDEDSQRKPAYHNGTAWTWVFPSFCEAWVKAYGDTSKETALAWLGSSIRNINRGCVGHVPEILDGDFPHAQRGCDAQAWGASELFRVLVELSE